MHFAELDDMTVAARRWTAAILGGVLGRDVPAPPRLTGATYDGAVTVELSFSAAAALVAGPTGGFTVETGGDPVAIESAEVIGAATVRLVLAVQPAGPLTVSLGQGRSGAGAPVPVESSEWHLPALTALRLSVASPANASSEALP